MNSLNLTQCRNCLYKSNHPLGILFDDKGICSGCSIHLEKEQLDWEERRLDLLKLVEGYRKQDKYDCIIPVTGGQDSFFTVHYVVNELKMNPLLVNFNRVFNTKEGIENLHKLRTSFGLDLHQSTISPTIAKRIIQVTLANLGTINWFWIAGHTSFPVRTARDLGIPLIIWGAHQGVEQVGMYSHLDNVEMTKRYRREHDLLGVDEQDIFKFDCGFSSTDINPICYPSDQELISSEIRGIYLSNYVRWDPVQQHELVTEMYSYKGRTSPRSYYEYDHPDCPVYMSLQDELKQIKFGYGKVTDQLCREIRHGRITKDEALLRNSEYLGKRDSSSILQFLDWLGASPRSYELLSLNFSQNFNNTFRELAKSGSTLKEQGEVTSDSDYDLFGKGLF